MNATRQRYLVNGQVVVEHFDKVLLFDTDGGWKPDELRSLGFLEVKPPSVNGRCYLFDPDSFNQPRDWNNPSDWANPQNFRKFRW